MSKWIDKAEDEITEGSIDAAQVYALIGIGKAIEHISDDNQTMIALTKSLIRKQAL
jgi:hypothetical protein